jgi:AdoMet-dependent heme synthase
MEAKTAVVATFKAPLYIAWEITHQCNANCLHCYSNSSPGMDVSHDLSTEEALSVIDQLAESGLLILAFSGGEPMLRRDWRELVRHAVARGLSVNLGTNGSSITAQTAQELKDLNVHSITVSIDSHLAEVHDAFRRLPGLHNHAIRAVQRLVEAGVRVVVGFTPTKINWQHGRHVVELAYQLGADAVNLSEYVPAGRGTIDLALSPAELRSVLEEWITLREAYQGRMQVIWHDCRVGMLVPESEQRNYVGCGAGRLIARICPDGTVTPCVFLPTSIGSFRQNQFSEIWNGSNLLGQFRERQSHIQGNCGQCEHLLTCGGCRAVAYAYSGGDPLAGDPHCWLKPEFDSTLSQLAEGEGLPV